MIVLGINAFHADSSAALFVEGELVAAAEEERFRRIKHWAGVPSESVKYCLESAGLSLGDVDALAINQNSRASLFQKIVYTISQRPDPRYVISRLTNRRNRKRVDEQLSQDLGAVFNGKLVSVEHHHAHLASSYLVSPFDKAVVASVDGFGDFASAAWGVGTGNTIEMDNKVHFPHSLGIFYQALTQYLGFMHYGDEYKVMGLAPYGKPTYLSQLEAVVLLQDDGSFELDLEYFLHHREEIAYEWEGGEPKFGRMFADALAALLGPARKAGEELEQKHMDIAHSVQAMYEKAFFHLLNHLHGQYGIDDLTLAGGCAMNSVANGKIYRNTPFKRAYIQAAAGDAGGAIGAAALVSSKGSTRRVNAMTHAYWGPEYSDDRIGKLLDDSQARLKEKACSCQSLSDGDLFAQIAARIAEGKVIGWFQGRMEWGPRALGNRSILGDPRRSDMKDILNLKIKRRESFRPFAPSVLREKVSSWFEEDDDVPFMMKVFQIRSEKRELIPAVTHVDGSGRLQTVSMETNAKYYQLIAAFNEISGVPMLLNTSFNENEPIVCRPEEALDCFLRTEMDVLVMGNWMISREHA